MNLVRNKDKNKIEVINDEGVKVLELGFIADEFVWILYTKDPIVLTEEDDAFLYANLVSLMNNEYRFATNISKKEENKIVWLSDESGDVEDEEITKEINRLLIEWKENQFYISFQNPYLDALNIKKTYSLISFSPSGNGIWSRNVNSGLTFQDDMVFLFQNVMSEIKPDGVVRLTKDNML